MRRKSVKLWKIPLLDDARVFRFFFLFSFQKWFRKRFCFWFFFFQSFTWILRNRRFWDYFHWPIRSLVPLDNVLLSRSLEVHLNLEKLKLSFNFEGRKRKLLVVSPSISLLSKGLSTESKQKILKFDVFVFNKFYVLSR